MLADWEIHPNADFAATDQNAQAAAACFAKFLVDVLGLLRRREASDEMQFCLQWFELRLGKLCLTQELTEQLELLFLSHLRGRIQETGQSVVQILQGDIGPRRRTLRNLLLSWRCGCLRSVHSLLNVC